MAVAFVNATSDGVAASPLTAHVPSGVLNNDILVMVVCVGGAAHLPSTPAGWTALDNEVTGPSVQSYWKIAASEPASYAVTSSGGALESVMYALRGGNGSSAINAHGAWKRTATSTSVSANSITPSVDNCMILFLGGIGSATGQPTGPGSYTQRGAPYPLTGGSAAMLADLLQGTAAPTGTVNATSFDTSNSDGSLIAVAPALVVASASHRALLGIGA